MSPIRFIAVSGEPPTLLLADGFFFPPSWSGQQPVYKVKKSIFGVDRRGVNSTFTYDMRRFQSAFLAVTLVTAAGCTAIIDGLSTDYYQRHYVPEISVEEVEAKSQPEPDIQPVAMRRHDTVVDSVVVDGWEVLGTAEFNTAASPRRNHLRRHARRLGAGRVVLSSAFDRREQDVVRRNEFVPGHWISVNGTIVQLPGRWVPTVDVVTRTYHDFRATFLRRIRE